MFDGWAASRDIDPVELPWDRFLNLVYHFAVRNATKERKQEFDSAINQAVAVDQMKIRALTSKNAVRSTQAPELVSRVPETTSEVVSERRSKLPPRPAGWGDDETATRQSLLVAQSLKVGGKTRS